MAKIAVLRDTAGNVVGTMHGDYTLLPGWQEETNTGQEPPPNPPTPERHLAAEIDALALRVTDLEKKPK